MDKVDNGDTGSGSAGVLLSCTLHHFFFLSFYLFFFRPLPAVQEG